VHGACEINSNRRYGRGYFILNTFSTTINGEDIIIMAISPNNEEGLNWN
jgi:hypothetical protein